MHRRVLRGAAFCYAVSWLTILAYLGLVMPLFGIKSADTLNDPVILLPSISKNPAVLVLPILDVFPGLSILIISLSLTKVGGPLNSFNRSFIFWIGSGLAVFFIYACCLRVSVLHTLACNYSRGQTDTLTAFELLNPVFNSISFFLNFLLGIWLSSVTYMLMQKKLGYFKLHCFGLVAGLSGSVLIWVSQKFAILLIVYSVVLGFTLFIGLKNANKSEVPVQANAQNHSHKKLIK